MHWFLNLMDELGIECRVGHLPQIRAAEPRSQKHDRRDAKLILQLLAEDHDITHLGDPVYFLTILGVWKILAVVACLFPNFPY
jgi:hypothetical protein